VVNAECGFKVICHFSAGLVTVNRTSPWLSLARSISKPDRVSQSNTIASNSLMGSEYNLAEDSDPAQSASPKGIRQSNKQPADMDFGGFIMIGSRSVGSKVSTKQIIFRENSFGLSTLF
jgi:hypothetical protein